MKTGHKARMVAALELELRLRAELVELERRLRLAGEELDRFYVELHSPIIKSGASSLGLSLGVTPDEIPGE